MGALASLPFCARGRDDNNNLPDLPDLNAHLETIQEVVEVQPEATSTPKEPAAREKLISKIVILFS